MRQLLAVKATFNHAVSTLYIVGVLAFSGVVQGKFTNLYDFIRWADSSQHFDNALSNRLVFGAAADGGAIADLRHSRSLQIESD